VAEGGWPHEAIAAKQKKKKRIKNGTVFLSEVAG